MIASINAPHTLITENSAARKYDEQNSVDTSSAENSPVSSLYVNIYVCRWAYNIIYCRILATAKKRTDVSHTINRRVGWAKLTWPEQSTSLIWQPGITIQDVKSRRRRRGSVYVH